jgi:O-methyltransferase
MARLRDYLPTKIRSVIRSAAAATAWRPKNEYQRDEYDDRYQFLRKALIALSFNGIQGDYAEFGCSGAQTFRMAYRILRHYPQGVGSFRLWAFDSFEGLPPQEMTQDEHPMWVAGEMATDLASFHWVCQAAGMTDRDYTAVQGFYDRSLLPDAPGPRPERIRLAYIDCDLYSSTRDVLRFLLPRFQHGMILAFDDYYCYSDRLPSGERLAAAELVRENPLWRLLPYVQFGWHGMSFVVERADARGNHESHW